MYHPPMTRARGRPKLPASEKRAEYVRVFLNPAEREAIERAAAAAGQSPPAWARERLVKAARRANG